MCKLREDIDALSQENLTELNCTTLESASDAKAHQSCDIKVLNHYCECLTKAITSNLHQYADSDYRIYQTRINLKLYVNISFKFTESAFIPL